MSTTPPNPQAAAMLPIRAAIEAGVRAAFNKFSDEQVRQLTREPYEELRQDTLRAN